MSLGLIKFSDRDRKVKLALIHFSRLDMAWVQFLTFLRFETQTLYERSNSLNHIVIAPRHPLFTPKKMNVICASTKMRVVRSFAIFKKFFVYF